MKQTEAQTVNNVQLDTDLPNQSASIDKLAAALVEVQSELTPVPRSETNPFFRSKYAAFETCVKHASPVLAKHGLAVIAPGEQTGDGRCAIATMLIHKSGQWIRGVYETSPTKNDPQGYGSAVTYLKRYGYCAMIGLPTEGEDDDANEASSDSHRPATKHKPTREYETEPATSPKSAGDLVELKAFLTESKVPESFLLAMLKEKKLVSAQLQHIANAPPGVIRRCLSPKSKENLVNAYKASESNGRETATRESDMDQRRMELRQPIDSGVNVGELLEQEGHEDWRTVRFHFGTKRGVALGELSAKDLVYWIRSYAPKKYRGRYDAKDVLLDAALCSAHLEMAMVERQQRGNE